MSESVTLLGYGEAARLSVSGPDRFERAQEWFDEVCTAASITDEVQRPGTGPVVLGSFGFSETDPSVLIIPAVVFGSDAKGSWVTHLADVTMERQPLVEPVSVELADGQISGQEYEANVALVVEKMRRGELDKVVLSRDLVATASSPFDERAILLRLAEAYDETWIFCVDGLVGATPEMLASVRNSHMFTRVLAGSWPTTSGHAIARDRLSGSAKDRREHTFAVDSVLQAIESAATEVHVDGPSILSLPNVVHFSTDISAELTKGTGLTVAGAMHPTAAVGGTPREPALDLIKQLDGSRGRYAAPVGWMDGSGNCDWALALRCAQIDPDDRRIARARAGGGQVTESVPEIEAKEVAAKFSAILTALHP